MMRPRKTHSKNLSDVRKNRGCCLWLHLDTKSEATIEHAQLADGSVELRKSHAVFFPAPLVESCQEQAVAWFSRPEETAPSIEYMCKLIEEQVTRKNHKENHHLERTTSVNRM